MGEEAKCKLGKKTHPTRAQWNFLPFLPRVPVPSVACVLQSDGIQTHWEV